MTNYRKQNRRKGVAKQLRRARDRYGSEKTQTALSEAILAVPGVTIFDEKRILRQLGEHLREFKHIERFQDFRAQVIAWATRQANLTVKLREILREIGVTDHVTTMLFLRLPEFAGADEEFAAWVRTTAKREQEGVEALVSWINTHRRAVRRGIWKALRGCLDLGIPAEYSDNEPDLIVNELETQVWRDVAYAVDKILSSNVAISLQLCLKGYWAAKAWKKQRLDEKKKHSDAKYIIGIDGLEKIVSDDNDEQDEVGVDVNDLIDPNANLNPIIIQRLPWTQADFDREVHRVLRVNRAGPFRADDVYEAAEQRLVAA